MEYRTLSDEVLMKLLKTDDEEAFKEIYKRYWHQLYKTAYSKLHLHEIAEEIVQNIFVKLWEKRTVSSILHLENYLQTSIKYQVINYYKSLLVKEKYLRNIKDESLATDTSATKLLLNELNIIIDKAMHSLSEKTQLIFNLSRKENYTVKEISENLQLSEKAVEYHITKSLKQLRVYLKEIITVLITFISISIFN
ncbi:MAG: sigma-70 family RNA polymerase sigma factor [Parafilimonas sp.]